MRQNNKKIEQAFRKWFVDMVYDNMAMENEDVLTKKEIKERCKLQISNLIKEGIHRSIAFPKKYYV